MRPFVRLGFAIGLAGAAASMAGCDKMSLDPDKLDFSLFDTKTKLPGDRKEVFPGGVPGVTPGVPPELVKGYHEQPDSPEQKAAEAKPKPKPAAGEQNAAEARPAPKPHVVQQPKPQPAQTASVQGTAPAAPAAPAAQAPGGPWPGQPQQQVQPQQQAQPQGAWPAPSPGR
jgi:hypothetical protein